MKRIETVIFGSLLLSHFTSLGTVVYATPTKMRSVVYKIVNGKQVSPEELRKGNLHGVLQTSRLSSSRLGHPGTSGTGGSVPRTRRSGYPETLQPGEAIYRPTLDEQGNPVKNAPPRPHLIIGIEDSTTKYNHTVLTVLDMSKLAGKGSRVSAGDKGNNYLLDVRNPHFSGKNATFVKLNKLRRIQVSNFTKQSLLGKIVGPDDLKEIVRRLNARRR